MSVIVTEVKARSDQCFPVLTLQGGAKNGANLSHCKYSENSMT